MKIFLTGVSGFLGQHIYKELINSGHNVSCLVRKPSGFVNEVVEDLNKLSVEKIIDLLENVDCIIHLAALADFTKDFSHDIYQTNCLATINLIWAAKTANIHFIFASNALIAGAQATRIDKNTPDNPTIPYNISKYVCERLIAQQLKSYTILRIGGIYGLLGPRHLYLNRAIQDALSKNATPCLNGNGAELRNYIYVKDLALCICDFTAKKTTGYLLVGGSDIKTMKNILELVAEICISPNRQININAEANNSFNQVITGDIMPVRLRTYEEALKDIKIDYSIENNYKHEDCSNF